MNCPGKIVLTMMLLSLVKLWLLVLMLMAMMLTPPTPLSHLLWSLPCLLWLSDEQYESIPDDEITMLARKLCALHKFHKERRRSSRGYFKCGDTTHFITDCSKRKKLDCSNKYKYNNKNRNDCNNKSNDKKKYCFRDFTECVLSWATLTSPVMTPSTQRRMRRSSANKMTSPALASWASLREISSTLTPI
jgi:hypothetical protein